MLKKIKIYITTVMYKSNKYVLQISICNNENQ